LEVKNQAAPLSSGDLLKLFRSLATAFHILVWGSRSNCRWFDEIEFSQRGKWDICSSLEFRPDNSAYDDSYPSQCWICRGDLEYALRYNLAFLDMQRHRSNQKGPNIHWASSY
jgi:hypothetical protein